MATTDLSNYDINSVPSGKNMKIAIAVSEWNTEITESLFNGAFQTLITHEIKPKNISKIYVPGTFELTFAANQIAKTSKFDAIIVLGCVIQGETRHFDFICQGIAYGITELNIKHNIPVIFGVLTTKTLQQAKDRSGGKHGNKGDEAAVTALKMANFNKNLKK